MKKQIPILLLLVLHFSSRSQTTIPTDGPCTDAMVMQVKGKWIKYQDPPTSKEVDNILNELHNMVIKIYPQPTGVDAAWGKNEGKSDFGAKRKFSTRPDGSTTYEDIEPPHFRKYDYRCGFFPYTCDVYNKNRMLPGYPDHSGTAIQIRANDGWVAIGGVPDEFWAINGMPVKMRPPVAETVGDYEFQHLAPLIRCVVIHRKGILPYIPVTRKQYLEQCISFHNKLWDGNITRTENLPVRSPEEQEKEKNARLAKFEKDFGKDPKRLKAAVDYYLSGYKTEQQIKDEEVQKAKKNRDRQLKKFTDELEKTTQQGLLDSPAMIRDLYNADIIFETDPLKAHMLVIDNRNYIRKDLPKHVPQLLIVWWDWTDWAPQEKIGEIIKKDFPFEKLQAMIR